MKNIDLKIVILLTFLCIPFAFLPQLNEKPMRILLGLSLMFFLPGYSFVVALFPIKNDLDGIERIALSFGLSIVVVSLLGLALNYTSLGIRLTPVLIVISTFTISLSFIAWFRRMKLPPEERFRVQFDRSLKINLGQNFLDKGLSLVLIASIIGSCATLTYVLVMPKTGERFTEFYLLSQNGTASDYPTDLKVGENGKVIIGIVNHEYENVTYRLEINFNGLLIHEESVLVNENKNWEIPFKFKATEKGEKYKLEFLLFKYKQIEAYRTLHLWVSVT